MCMRGNNICHEFKHTSIQVNSGEDDWSGRSAFDDEREVLTTVMSQIVPNSSAEEMEWLWLVIAEHVHRM